MSQACEHLRLDTTALNFRRTTHFGGITSIITGHPESQRAATVRNLVAAGYGLRKALHGP
jgi:hypothetical protein